MWLKSSFIPKHEKFNRILSKVFKVYYDPKILEAYSWTFMLHLFEAKKKNKTEKISEAASTEDYSKSMCMVHMKLALGKPE